MHWNDITPYLGDLAAVLVFTTFWIKTMIPLRAVATTSNVVYILSSIAGGFSATLVLHTVLLPINVWRMAEMIRLVKRVKQAATGEKSIDWLRPFMKSASCKAGHVLFRKGDEADRLYVLLSGELVFEEIGVSMQLGQMFGEIALFSPEHRRTQTARAKTDIHLLWISEADLAQLCYQNPAVSFHLLRLITGRLLANASRPAAVAQPVSNA